MSNNLPLYNVSDYTDAELYNILDLVNPTDRELEAKILMQIHKYENIGTKSAQKLARFFDDIYNHFFETDEHEDVDALDAEEYANIIETFDGTITNSNKPSQAAAGNDPSGPRRVNRAAQSTIDANIADSAVAPDPTKSKPTASNNMMSMSDKSAPETQTVGYTQNLAYTKGKLNPILQQTTKRIISIDSQYRSDKRTMSTSFTFNLSEPLKDVVSLKLYSVQIPYTWYTIGKAYGNNFFYIKGRTSGIDSGSGIHDIEVSIAPGNYSPAELIGAVNNSIAYLKKSRTDISLGNTSFSYNYNTSLTTANIDLKNGYNQSSYVINFDTNAIPNYLGFIQSVYSIRTLRSRFDTYDISSQFNVTQNNNYFTIKLYEDNFTTLKSSFNIVIDTGAYTRLALINKVKTTLSTSTSLTNTDCSISSGGTYIDLTLQPSRFTNAITINTKTQIVFYDFQYYNVDFTNTIFTNQSQDISGNIGNAINGNIPLIINPTLIDESGQIIIPPKQLLCKIKTKFYNGNSTISYNNEEVFHEIKSAFNSATTYNNLPTLYSDLATAFTSYEYAGIKIFADTTITNNGILSLSVVADTRIWTNLHGIDGTVNIRSCFGFEREINNMNETNSELPATEQSGDYTIYTEPFVYFTPNNAIYRDGLNGINDLSFSIPKSSETGSYKMNDYINVINQSIRDYDLSHNNVFNSPASTYTFDNTTAYPSGTYAYLQNDIFQMHVGISKIFDESMYSVDLAGSIFDNIHVNRFTPSNLLNNLSLTYQTFTDSANIDIDANTIVFTLKPKLNDPPINGNENEPNVVIKLGDISGGYLDSTYTLPSSRQFDDIINGYIQPLFAKYTDPLSNVKILENSVINATTSTNGFNISLKVDIKKTLLAKNYRISFNDATAYNVTWNANLKISTELLNNNYIDTSNNNTFNSTYRIYDNSKNLFYINANQVDTSGNILDSSGNILDNNGKILTVNNGIQTLSGRVMYTVIPNGNVKISGISTIPRLIPIDINVLNNTFSFKAVDDGVATSTGKNDVTITIPTGKYFRDTLINAINAQIRATSTGFTNITGTEFSIVNQYNNYYTSIVTNLKREYTTSDYNLVFYDKFSFATCTVGSSSVQNTTWDTTIGWIMGFREYTTYDMSAPGTIEDTVVDAVNGNVITIIGDTGLSTNLYNYFLICLDDFNQNHLNDGLVTITNVDTSIPLPSYASRTDFVCDPATGQKIYNVSSGLTERQIYAAQAAANSRTINESIGSSISANSYGSGPFVSDVFGIIPMKVSGLANGGSYVEFGGTLQNQERSYFGPVNIHRMSVRLVTDRGNLVDLNKANWSFSLVCEQLNKLDPTGGK
jgi:hypothetical protein